MPTVSASNVYPAPVGKVWALLTDPATYPRWNSVHVSFPGGAPETLEPAVTFTQKIKNMGMPSDIKWTVATVEPNHVLELEGKAPMNVSVQMRYELAEVDGGTRVDVRNQFEGAMIKMMAKRLTEAGQADLDKSMTMLGDALG
jgi:uncharacterized protein YndB with AHSA1/START domain